MAVTDLFGEAPSLQPRGSGYAGDPGRGPVGMKCKDCRHCQLRSGGARSYYKCDLVRRTGGPGTDIRMGMPACERFERVGNA